MKKYTTEEFIKKAHETHGDKYDYSKVEYVNARTKVCIICPEHGEFYITPGNFLFGQGCRLCGIKEKSEKRKLTNEEFILRARQVHGWKYDYSKINYINIDTKVCIICPEHGEFWQTPYNHLNGNGCPKCANNLNYTTEEFIKRAKEIHGDKYDYSKVEYVNSYNKVCIICPEHGEFYIKPGNHLHGVGCPKCKGKYKTTEEFINEIKKIHDNKYDYTNTIYNGAFNPVRIICLKHGEFITTPHSLLAGCGCKKCGNEISHLKQKLSTEEFIKRARKVHGNKYDYSKVNYINAKTPICITCHKKDKYGNEHGEFWLTPNSHTSTKKCGCPKCTESCLENDIRVFCENNKINYIQEKRFSWLGLQRLDFYLPDYNIAIECQGYYHFEPHYTCKTTEDENEYLLKQIQKDENKYYLLNNNKIRIYYYIPKNLLNKIKISKIYNNQNIFTNVDELLKILNLV